MLTNELFIFYRHSVAIKTNTGVSITYDDIATFGEVFNNKIGHRCLIFNLCQNTLGSLLGYTSCISNQIVPLLLDANIDSSMLENLISIYNPEYIWLPEDRIYEFKEKDIIFNAHNYSLIHLEHKNKHLLHQNLAVLLTTSGSTGSPKLVRISYENIEANAVSIAEYLDIDNNERPITTLPMSYSFGLSIINSHLLKGATILLTSKTMMEKDFWTFLKDNKATTFSGVPYTFEILKKLRFFRMDLPSIKTLTQAGGKLNDELNKEFAEYCFNSGKRFFVMYGQTEATARMSYLPPQYSLTKTGSMGIAIPGGEFSLIDEKGAIINGNEIVGELVYQGKNVSMGYAECGADLLKEDENLGVLITGDMAKRDSDNFYYIVGRKKRFIKIFGNRVNLDETERLLKSIISDCACTGTDDHMLIYITDSSRQDEVRNYISLKTGIHHSAFSVRHLNSIPKNSSGKTIYKGLEI